jgi:hypothetical protein
VDADKASIIITTDSRTTGPSGRTFAVAKDAKILQDNKEARLGDLKTGGRVTVQLSPAEKTVVAITVTGATMTGALKSVDAAVNTVTVVFQVRRGPQEKTFRVAKDVRVTVDGKEAKLTDLKAGTVLALTGSVADPDTLIQIRPVTGHR